MKAKLNVYVHEYSQDRYIRAHQKDDHAGMISAMTFFDVKETGASWTKVGTAEVVVTLDDDDTVRDNLVASLREEKSKVLAEAQAKATQIEDRIQSLLAITWNGEK